MKIKEGVFILVSLLVLTSIACAQTIVLDIKTDKQTYSVGENVTYTILLLQDGVPLQGEVSVSISDAMEKKNITDNVLSNEPQNLLIDKDFSSGFWSIDAQYEDKSVRRIFSVGEREEVEFSIQGDKLIIKNNGNVPYAKTVQILIGDKVITQKQNIRVGDFKEIRLIAPDGSYNIQVTDGVQTISKSNVFLVGTGKVIGALDEQLVGNTQTPLGGVRSTEGEDQFVFSQHFSLAFIFIGAVGALALLIFVERLTRRRAMNRLKANVAKIAQQHQVHKR